MSGITGYTGLTSPAPLLEGPLKPVHKHIDHPECCPIAVCCAWCCFTAASAVLAVGGAVNNIKKEGDHAPWGVVIGAGIVSGVCLSLPFCILAICCLSNRYFNRTDNDFTVDQRNLISSPSQNGT